MKQGFTGEKQIFFIFLFFLRFPLLETLDFFFSETQYKFSLSKTDRNVWLSALGQTFHGDFPTAQSLDLPFSSAAQPLG